jgi:hypothetical protein
VKRANIFGLSQKERMLSRPSMVTAAHGGISAHQKTAPKSKAAQLGGVYKGYGLKRTADGDWYSSLDPSSWFETKAQAQKHIDWYLKNRSNPPKKSHVEKLIDMLPPIAAASFTKKQLAAAERRYKKQHGNPAKFDRCVKDVQRRGGAANAYAVCTAAGARKRNPAAGAEAAFEEFHGHPSEELVTVKKRVHHHKYLAGAGELRWLRVRSAVISGRVVRLQRFKGAILAFNEEKNQLFIEGGDQSVNLKDFGITEVHEVYTLGRILGIGYYTRKDHLGDEGGEALYEHEFRMTNRNSRHIVVKISRYPDLIYYERNQELVFSGGSYEIRAEGIDK